MNRRPLFATLAAAGLALTACSSPSDSPAEPEASATAESCTKESLATLEPGTLTIATGEPAYEPWVKGDAPESGEGFEAAVAYALAERLGFTAADVQWVRTTFDGAIAPGAKTFDWNLQQFTITEDREKAVDFSSPYYSAPQAVITYGGSSIDGATSIDDLRQAKLGAAVGSTSLDAAQSAIAPEQDVQVFNDNAAAVAALKNEQIDGIVVDLPTAVYLVDVEVEGGTLIGALPVADDYGILLGADSPLTACTSQAVDELRADGTLDSLVDEWLDVYTSVPILG
jgi:polar amino acid transport system substrate-binding protein